MIAAVGIMGLVGADTSGLTRSIETTLPGDSGAAITEAFKEADQPSQATSRTAAILGIAAALWSASSGMVALQSGLNIAYDVPQDRKFVGKRATALALISITAMLGGVPSPFFTFGESTLFLALGWSLTIAAVVVLFSVFYYLEPNRDSPRWQWVSVGGVCGAVLWIAVSLAFGFYVNNYSNYSKTYGSLAGVIVLILWLYLSSLAVLIGGDSTPSSSARPRDEVFANRPEVRALIITPRQEAFSTGVLNLGYAPAEVEGSGGDEGAGKQ